MTYRFKLCNNVRALIKENDLLLDRPYVNATISPGPNIRNSYVSLNDDFHQWFVDNKICYNFVYVSWLEDHFEYGFYIEIDDKEDALLYKLTYGGSI
jgi:hypothetical protein